MEEKELINIDLHGISEKKFDEQITNDFIGGDFIEQLEWAMLLIQSKFKQIKLGNHLKTLYASHFDKSYLMSSSLKDNQLFYKPFTDLQAGPEIFPNINIKYLIIKETVQFNRIKELPLSEKRNLMAKLRYVYDHSVAYYKKDTESFYGIVNGYETNGGFLNEQTDDYKYKLTDIPCPISLRPGYRIMGNPYDYVKIEEAVEIMKILATAYQVAMSMYYEWCIYVKEYDGIGLVIPIEPQMLSEIYKSSLLKFENRKRMLHFVRDHYRRKAANINEDYSVYVRKYLRGEHKFEYRGFYTEIIPPKYDLNRIKTKKKFIDANS
jgi:hypothetical protein